MNKTKKYWKNTILEYARKRKMVFDIPGEYNDKTDWYINGYGREKGIGEKRALELVKELVCKDDPEVTCSFSPKTDSYINRAGHFVAGRKDAVVYTRSADHLYLKILFEEERKRVRIVLHSEKENEIADDLNRI